MTRNPTTLERCWRNRLWGQGRSPGNGSIGPRGLLPLPRVPVWRSLRFQSFFPLDPGIKCFSVAWLGKGGSRREKKEEIQTSFRVQWIICDFGEDSVCPALFPGCFQPHQVLPREAPGAQYFARTGCIYLPMCGFRDWLHQQILGLTLGYIYVICVCIHIIYMHSCYLCTYTCTVPVICMYLFQNKKDNIEPVSLFFFYMKLKILVVLLDWFQLYPIWQIKSKFFQFFKQAHRNNVEKGNCIWQVKAAWITILHFTTTYTHTNFELCCILSSCWLHFQRFKIFLIKEVISQLFPPSSEIDGVTCSYQFPKLMDES